MNNGIMQQFDSQRHRGTEGFGLFDGQEMNMVHATKEDNILKWLVKYPSNLLMFHHRRPTSTVNVKRAAHPFSTKDYFGKTQYILVHNGHVSNAKSLFTKHKELGVEYQSLLQDGTFNDSESLLWDLALFLEGKTDKTEAYGGVAFVCLKLKKGKLDKMYFGRNTNPLNLFRNKNGIALSSEGPGEEIEADTLYTWNYELKRLTKKKMNIARWQSTYVPSSTPLSYSEDDYSGGWYSDWGWEYNPYTQKYEDDYGEYDTWEEYRTAKQTRESQERLAQQNDHQTWLSDKIKKKYGKYLDKKEEPQVFDKDAQMYLPMSTVVERGKKKREEKAEQVTYTPLKAEVETVVMEYLLQMQGHFDSAYWALEQAYVDLELEPPTAETEHKLRVIEQAIEYLFNDPEYKTTDSVSSTWRTLWAANKT